MNKANEAFLQTKPGADKMRRHVVCRQVAKNP